jgi:hypothetical protein
MNTHFQFNMLQKQRLIACTLTLVLFGGVGNSSLAQPSSSRLTSSRPNRSLPPPPFTPPPNQTRPGGSLGEDNPCDGIDQSLVALAPVENPVLTTSTYPTFLFYVPYKSEDVQFGEFSIFVGTDDINRLYRTRFALPDTPGVISISLPASPEYAIAEDVFYHWHFKLYCQGNTSANSNLYVNGWVKRVALTPEREQQINAATPEIWYDAVARLGDRLRTSPQDNELRNHWRNLLEFINSGDLAQEPLVGPVQILGD